MFDLVGLLAYVHASGVYLLDCASPTLRGDFVRLELSLWTPEDERRWKTEGSSAVDLNWPTLDEWGPLMPTAGLLG